MKNIFCGTIEGHFHSKNKYLSFYKSVKKSILVDFTEKI